jgi:hypothetical protein
VGTDSGSLRLTLPDGQYNVTVRTDSGGRHVNVPTSPKVPAKIDLRTDSGSVSASTSMIPLIMAKNQPCEPCVTLEFPKGSRAQRTPPA